MKNSSLRSFIIACRLTASSAQVLKFEGASGSAAITLNRDASASTLNLNCGGHVTDLCALEDSSATAIALLQRQVAALVHHTNCDHCSGADDHCPSTASFGTTGTATVTDRFFGATAAVSCAEHHLAVGSPGMKCQADRTWASVGTRPEHLPGHGHDR